MRVIGIHDINTLFVMDGIEIDGRVYKAKELIDSPTNEADIAEAWRVVDNAIKRRIEYQAHPERWDGDLYRGV